MKNRIALFLMVLIFIGCKSSSKELALGAYDAALEKAAKKIKKHPQKADEEVGVFNDAYLMATTRDEDELLRLKKKGDPALWAKIFQRYLQMNKRQDLAKSLPDVGIKIKVQDYKKELDNARLKAAEYAYAKGVLLMSSGNRFDARTAYSRFMEVKGYEESYKDVAKKISEAQQQGMTNIYLQIENQSNKILPLALIDELQTIDVSFLDDTWKKYDVLPDENKMYHYLILFNIADIEVSPEQVTQNIYTESREIEDGFQYELNANGTIKKDTLGKAIKIPKYRTIACNVREINQSKSAYIGARIDFINNLDAELLKREPANAETFFRNNFLEVSGDLNALTQETKNRLGADALPFPMDEAMLFEAAAVLKQVGEDVLVGNEDMLK